MKTKFLVLGIAFTLLTLNSCKKDEVQSTAVITAEETVVNAQLDAETDDVTNLVNTNLTAEEGMGLRYIPNSAQALPTCATVTRTPTDLTNITVGTTITKTIDFGTSGCALPNGNILKGKIIMTFSYQPIATKKVVTCAFVDFYHNAIKISGTKTYTREFNTNQKLQTTVDIAVNATYPNGNIHTRNGQRIFEMQTLLTYKVWGSWTTTFPNTKFQTCTVDAKTPLFVDYTCLKYPITSGIIQFTRENNSASLNYGDGTCDNAATLSVNGTSLPIFVGK